MNNDNQPEPAVRPETCPDCGNDYIRIDVLPSERPGEEPDYVFVHDEEHLGGSFTRINDSCRMHEHEALQ